MVKLIVCDWNRTLFEDRCEEVFFKGLYKETLLTAFRKLNFLKVYSLIHAQNKCTTLFRSSELNENKEHTRIVDITNILNEEVIKGVPVQFLKKYTEKYAKNAINRLDKRLLEPLKNIKLSRSIRMGIISSGYGAGIQQVLVNAGYKFDFIKANDFEIDSGNVVKFKLDIFDNKKEILKKLLLDNDVSRENVVYIGDDWQDEGCFQEVGYPVVSFLAKDEYKKYFSEKLKAFVPNSANEFTLYLQRLLY